MPSATICQVHQSDARRPSQDLGDDDVSPVPIAAMTNSSDQRLCLLSPRPGINSLLTALKADPPRRARRRTISSGDMDPLSHFPVEVSVRILENIELEELLLSTRFTSRAWNDILFAQLSHLIVASYYVRIELGRTRLDIPLRLRHAPDGSLEIHGSETVARRVHTPDDVRYFAISAGIVNRGVSRAFMSNHGQPTLISRGSVEGRRIYEAEVKTISYSNAYTNTGSLDNIDLDLSVVPFAAEDPDAWPVQSRVSVTIKPAELTRWIVLCRLAQGYLTPDETREMSSPLARMSGLVGPYKSYKNSAGIWGPNIAKVKA